MFKAGKSMRFLLFNASTLMWLAIFLTGFDVVHWLSCWVPGFFLFAALTGFCPGLIFGRRIFAEN